MDKQELPSPCVRKSFLNTILVFLLGALTASLVIMTVIHFAHRRGMQRDHFRIDGDTDSLRQRYSTSRRDRLAPLILASQPNLLAPTTASSLLPPHVYAAYINVEAAAARRLHMERLLASLRLPFSVERLVASLPSSPETQLLIDKAGSKPWWKRGKGEVACLASTIRLWKQLAAFAQSDNDWALCFEDDVVVNPKLQVRSETVGTWVQQTLQEVSPSVGMIQFMCTLPHLSSAQTETEEYALATVSDAAGGERVAILSRAYCNAAYAVRKHVLKAILQHPELEQHPADVLWDSLFPNGRSREHGLRVGFTEESLRQDDIVPYTGLFTSPSALTRSTIDSLALEVHVWGYRGGEWFEVFVTCILQAAFPTHTILWTQDQNKFGAHGALRLCVESNQAHSAFVLPPPNGTPTLFITSETRGMSDRDSENPVLCACLPYAVGKEKNSFYVPFAIQVMCDPVVKEPLRSAPFVLDGALPLSERTRSVGYAAINCVPFREELFTALAQALGPETVQVGGKCHGTVVLPPSAYETPHRYLSYNDKRAGHDGEGARWWPSKKLEQFGQCKFLIAAENEMKSGYVTEKLPGALLSGAIPIYWGDTEYASKLFNPAAFIDVSGLSVTDAVSRVLSVAQTSQVMLAMARAPKLTETGAALMSWRQAPEKGFEELIEYIRAALPRMCVKYTSSGNPSLLYNTIVY